MKILVDAVRKYLRFKRLVKEFKRTHHEIYTIHQNTRGEEWIDIKWAPGVEA